MLRGLLASADYRPQFSGHETFPLRQLWLRKAYEAVATFQRGRAPKGVFADPDSIVRFGVGKNMVSAIRHWALACDVIVETDDGMYAIGVTGEELFGKGGLDPYLEHPASAWLVHWYLAGEGRRSTTWYWLFNHTIGPVFERDEVVASLRSYCEANIRSRASSNTLSRDVDVCLRSYAPRASVEGLEEMVEPVLGELSLIAHVRGAQYMFRVGPKPNLPDGVLLFALHRFWQAFAPTVQTLSLDVLAYERGSIGAAFKFDVDSLAERLVSIEEASGGAFAWSETAGLKQVIRKRQHLDAVGFLRSAYKEAFRGRSNQ
jgi:hypothetical protein